MEHGGRFRVGDQLRAEGSAEVMLVTAVSQTTGAVAVVRGYGGTTPEALSNDQKVYVIGNAALEGADAPGPRFTNRTRKTNYTQIFSAGVEVSGSQQAVNTIGIADELEYQKQERLRELLRDLENSVLNGVASATTPEGSATVRRSMNGILPSLSTNLFMPGVGGVPAGGGAGEDELTEEVLNAALRAVWEQSAAPIDTIVVNGTQKRRINSFASQLRGYQPGDTTFSDLVSVYESDYGVCKVLLSRWLPADAVLLLDSSRIDVLPLSGRSFHFKPLSSAGDRERGLVVGEYTLELMNENAHGVLTGLAV
jgi:hypothetical protein